MGGFFTGKFLVHFSLVKNCPEFLTMTTTSYFYLTFLLSLWPTTIPIVQKTSRVLHRISTDVSTEKLCAENSLFHVYSCPEMTKFKFTFKKQTVKSSIFRAFNILSERPAFVLLYKFFFSRICTFPGH